ncbi:MAG: nicotinate (nicotinamide) nucleotide adenylyltransferase [Balneola sp.]|nr:nicotinate (nicotinamide) nucleotide adenylyltransferase [Balneola sp.]|tara:strand:- start:831 stop:1409 length:579 start_codon:yes stop_codon:yes gene_type:complete
MLEKRIGLFGGSFDPIHLGHLAILESFLSSGYIDELWVLVNPYPPHKNSLDTSYSDRLRMVELATKNINRCLISRIEENLQIPNFSFKTIDYVIDTLGFTEVYFCLGSDSIENFKNWKNYEKILDRVMLLVARRKAEFRLPSYLKMRAILVEHELVSVSSTKLREKLLQRSPLDDQLHSTTLEYIIKHNLYR